MPDSPPVVVAPPAKESFDSTASKVISSAAAQPEIKVGKGGTIPVNPSEKPGSAKSKLFGDLRKKAGTEPADPPAEPVTKTPAEPPKEPAAAAEPPKDPPTDPAKSAAEPAKKDKINPWKGMEEWKGRAKELEQQLLEAEKRAIPEAKWKDMESQLEAATKRRDELEQEIRFHDYSKSDEFKTKYQQPYEAAWKRAMDNLKGLTVQDAEGNERDIAPADILALVNTDNLREARAKAKEMFGDDFANDVMNHRNEIRRLYDEQSAALEDARKTATNREKEQKEAREKQYGEMTTAIKADWKTANDEATADPKYGKYFTPKEGDAEGNQALAKGFELADRAFTENPMAPGLTAEQRKEITRRHAAIRNRAAAFGRVRKWYEQALTQIETLTKELAEYKGTEPPAGGGRDHVKPNGASKMESLFGELRKKVK